MSNVNELIGKVYYYLTVVRYVGGENRLYECKCRCGNTCLKKKRLLGTKKAKSCGCFRTANALHLDGSKTQNSWRKLRSRCDDPKNEYYHLYGGRGITYDPRWKSFREFYNDMGIRPEGKTLDRIDTNGNYCKENCRWATAIEQGNNMRTNVLLTYNGVTKTATQWAFEKNITWAAIRWRIAKGWPPERILNTPGVQGFIGHSERKKRLIEKRKGLVTPASGVFHTL